MSQSLRILMIGALPPPVGGTTTMFQNLLEGVRSSSDLVVESFNLSRGYQSESLIGILRVTVALVAYLLMHGRSYGIISFHANLRGRIYLGPIVYLISRLIRRPLMMRVYGGAFVEQYESLPALHRWLLRQTYFKAEACLFETHAQTDYFAALPIRRSEWFPNYRANAGLTHDTPLKTECKKLVFLGRIVEVKGIDIMLEAAPDLPEGVSISVYGPLSKTYTPEVFAERGAGRVHYGGILSKEEIFSQLWDYDALVLPTFHNGEGYPGVILEAYAHGLPVITTRWMSIPEIVDEDSGILIEPHDSAAFVDAVKRLNQDQILYERLQRGARKKIRQLDAPTWTQRFVALCHEIGG